MFMKKAVGLFAVVSALAIGCAHTPTKAGERADLTADAQNTLQKMQADNPDLQPLIDNAVGYIVFPRVGEGGFIVGGGAGSGVVFENGVRTGFAEVTHASVGALAGGQRYAELIVVRDRRVLEDMKSGRFDFGANANAVILRSGAAANANFSSGVAVFIQPIRGAMVNASLTGQRIKLSL